MIDLNKLENKIDQLLKNETSDSMTKWLLNKRFGNINVLLNKCEFISLKSQNKPIDTSGKKPQPNTPKV